MPKPVTRTVATSMRRGIMIGMAVALGAGGASAAASAAAASALCVGPGPHCYSTIQAAVNAAHNGDTIRIAPGRFKPPRPVRRMLTLWSNNLLTHAPLECGSSALRPDCDVVPVFLTQPPVEGGAS